MNRVVLHILCLCAMLAGMTACSPAETEDGSGKPSPKPEVYIPKPLRDSALFYLPAEIPEPQNIAEWDHWEELISGSDLDAPEDFHLHWFYETEDSVYIVVTQTENGNNAFHTWLNVDLKEKRIIDIGAEGQQEQALRFDPEVFDKLLKVRKRDSLDWPWECETEPKIAFHTLPDVRKSEKLDGKSRYRVIRAYGALRRCHGPYLYRQSLIPDSIDPDLTWAILRLMMGEEEMEAVPDSFPVHNMKDENEVFSTSITLIPDREVMVFFRYDGGETTYRCVRLWDGRWLAEELDSPD